MTDFDRFNRDFDRDFDKASRWIDALAIISAIVSLAFAAVLIWAVVQIVQWMVTK